MAAYETRRFTGSLYARGGIPDYWMLNLVDRVLEVYREPRADAVTPFGWRYAHSEVRGVDASVTPLAVPTARAAVSQLLP